MINLCIIPARGGSKRIPRKNIKDFLGKPIIAYSIEAAFKSGLFDEVMVSTDDKEVAEVAKQYGAKVPFMRSKENSNDFAIINDVFIEVINNYKKRNVEFDYTCMIFPTSPLIQENRIGEAFDLLLKKDFDSIRPIVKFSYPIQRAFRLDGFLLSRMHPENFRKRSQDLEAAYHDAGQFYWINKNCSLLDENKGGIVISDIEAQDIDNEDDWKLAESKYRLLHSIK